jgi:agmatinase
VARDLGFTVLTTTQLLARTPQEIGELVRQTVGDSKAFLSFDVDFFDPAYAPGTGTPEVGGPTSFQGLGYLRACTGVRWVGGDVVEVLPALDHAQITAHLAAQVGYEFLSLVALGKLRAGH